MRVPDKESIDSWIEEALDLLEQTEQDFRSGWYEQQGVSLQSGHTGAALFCAVLGRAKFLKGDPIKEVRAEFANGARRILKSFTMAYDETDPDYQGQEADWEEVSETEGIEGINFALMAADFALAETLARWFRNRGDGDSMDVVINRYAHALKYALLGDRQQALDLLKTQLEAYAAKPPRRRDYRYNFFTLSTALFGIMSKDEALFNQGLQEQLAFHAADGESKGTDEEFICDDAVALANLGLHHGLHVTIEHDTLPKGLLIEDPRGKLRG